MLAWVTLPLAVRLAHAVFTILGPALNKTLAGTAELTVLYAIAPGGGGGGGLKGTGVGSQRPGVRGQRSGVRARLWH